MDSAPKKRRVDHSTLESVGSNAWLGSSSARQMAAKSGTAASGSRSVDERQKQTATMHSTGAERFNRAASLIG